MPIDDTTIDTVNSEIKKTETPKKEDDIIIYGIKNIWDENIFINIHNSPEYYKEDSDFEYIERKDKLLHQGIMGDQIIVKNAEIEIYFYLAQGDNRYNIEFINFLKKTDKYYLSKYVCEYPNIIYNEYINKPYIHEYSIDGRIEKVISYVSEREKEINFLFNEFGQKDISFLVINDVIQRARFGFQWY
jgi:hypothetical protein